MRLRDDVAGQLFPPVVVVTLAAPEVELALPPVPDGSPRVQERLRLLVDGDGDGHVARLARDECRQREELAALPGEGRRLLPLGAAAIDALFQIDRPPSVGVERRIARGHALHARPGVTVAV